MKTTTKQLNLLVAGLLATPLLYSGAAISQDFDVTPQIVGGKESQPYSRLYQVALLMNGQQGCGGTLISDRWVLTAAHCLDNASTNSLSVRVGAHSLSQNDGQTLAVSQIITHENWRGANGIRSGYDIGLLRLASPAIGEYTPAKLPTQQIEQTYASIGRNVTVSGWGLTSNQGRPSDRLREVDLPVISNQSCSSELNFNLPGSVICGGGAGGVSACNGDSGGPFAIEANGQFYSIGTVSWGQGCRGATAFTRTTSYLNWIQQKTGIGTDVPTDEKPMANFSYTVNDSVVTFSSTSTDDKGIVSHYWQFGDGQQSNETNPSHSYSPGSYTAVLTVTDTAQQQTSISKTVTVNDDTTPPGCDGLNAWSASISYALGDQVSYQGNKYEAIWWSTGAIPSIYNNVWANKGTCSGGDSNQPPKASFSISKNGLSVNFSNSSTDDKAVTSSSWDFGDGTYSNANSPTHTFVAAGSYQVTLTVSDAQGLTSQTSQQVSVSSGDTGGCSGIATWDPTKIYLSGSKVQLNNKVYQANWWVQGLNPESSGQWGPWSMVGQCN